MWHVRETEELYTGSLRVNESVRDHLEYVAVDGRITPTCIFK